MQRLGIPAEHLGDHGIDRYRLFQLVVLHQAQAFQRHWSQLRRLAHAVARQLGKALKDFAQKAIGDALALQAQLTHRLEQIILLGIRSGTVSHLEQAVVGVIEQRLQVLFKLEGSLVTQLRQRHGQSSYLGVRGMLRGRTAQRHHIRISLHFSSPAGQCPAWIISPHQQPERQYKKVNPLASISLESLLKQAGITTNCAYRQI